MAPRSASRSGAAAKAAPVKQSAASEERKPVSLRTAIEGLQFILALSTESPNDPRLAVLVPTIREDVIEALRGIHGGDDQGKVQDPDEN